MEKDGNASMRVTNNQRITASLPTLKHCIEQGAKALILLSHLGRPDGVRKDSASLRPVAAELEKLIASKVHFIDECVGSKVEEEIDSKISASAPGTTSIFLLENVRYVNCDCI